MVFSLARNTPIASAAAANTVNFQARLQTASGAIVPDGYYNVEFKLYSGDSCNPSDGSGCTAEWTEDYLNSASKGLQTVNGYLSANLGSVQPFPSTVKWDQKLWLSMNIGGTGDSASWDGAMFPYLSLTAVPAAFSASQLATSNASGRSTLTLQGSSNGDQNFVIQDQGAAGTYNLLTQNQADVSYIQNGTSLQSGDFNISGSGVADTLQGTTAVITPAIRPVSDSTSALQVQNAAGTVSVLTVDTTNDRIGIGTDAPTATIDVKGATADDSSIALNVQNSMGGSLITARDDGQVTIGTTADSGTSATFGSMANTTADTGNDSNFFTASKFTTGSNPGTLTSISVYVNAIDPSTANDKFRLAIYADDGSDHPTTLIAQSSEGTLSPNTFNTLPVSASLAANTEYWLAYQTNGTGPGYNDFSTATGAAKQYYAYSNAYGSFPSTASTGGANAALAQAMYGTYTEAGTGTVPALTVSATGNVGIGGVTTPSTALQVQGTVAASALSISGNATATAFQAGLFDTASASALNIGTSNATSVTIGSSVAPSKVIISNGDSGGTFINYASTLNPAASLGNFSTDGPIGTAATTVDIHTSFTLSQTSTGVSLSVPDPTDTTAGRIIYIANTGSATVTVSSVVMGAGTSASFFWNGSDWISTAVSTGVSIIGNYSSSSFANGASITGNTLTLGVADADNPGMVSTTDQTFAGNKTLTGNTKLTGTTTATGDTTVADTSATAFQIQNTGGTSTLFTADTSTMRISVGNIGTATGQLYVAGTVPTYSAQNSDSNLNDPRNMTISGRTAYVIDRSANKLDAYNVASGTPTYVGQNSDSNLSAPFAVAAAGHYVYVVNNASNKLTAYDISSGTPTYVGQNSDSNLSNPQALAISGRYAFVTSYSTHKVVAYDISGGTPVFVGKNSDSNLSGPSYIAAAGGYVYVVDSASNKLLTYNITSGTPVYVGQNSDSSISTPEALTVSGNYAYIPNDGASNKLLVYNITSATPVYVGQNSDSNLSTPYDVAISGRYAYVLSKGTSKLVAYDISSGTPVYIGANSDSNLSSPVAVALYGGYAFVTSNGSDKLVSYSLGGAYLQQVQSGSASLGSLSVDGNSTLMGNATVQGGLSVGQSLQVNGSTGIQGALGVGGTISSNSLSVGSAAQFQVDASGNFTSTGSGTIKLTSTTAFSVQDASNSYFNVDTSSGTITLGNASSGNYVTFTAAGGLNAFGSARHGKMITLTPEYAGAALDASSDSVCSGANNGTLTSGYDSTNVTNYYQWTSAQTSAQCYDVVVQVPIPSDFDSWANNPLSVQVKASNTSNASYAMEILKTGGSADTTFCSTAPTTYCAPTAASTSWANITSTSNLSGSAGSYTAGNYFTIKIRMSASNNATLQLGNITLNYNSKF